eukprot:UN05967
MKNKNTLVYCDLPLTLTFQRTERKVNEDTEQMLHRLSLSTPGETSAVKQFFKIKQNRQRGGILKRKKNNPNFDSPKKTEESDQ